MLVKIYASLRAQIRKEDLKTKIGLIGCGRVAETHVLAHKNIPDAEILAVSDIYLEKAKAFEARRAIEDGAHELDMVVNVGMLKSGHLDYVENDIRTVRRATRQNTVLKVIIETSLLSDEEKVIACELSKKAGADFVKTCTGFAGGGANPHDISLMRRTVGPDMGVKASGGMRNYPRAVQILDAGANRIGAVSSVAIVTGQEGQGGY